LVWQLLSLTSSGASNAGGLTGLFLLQVLFVALLVLIRSCSALIRSCSASIRSAFLLSLGVPARAGRSGSELDNINEPSARRAPKHTGAVMFTNCVHFQNIFSFSPLRPTSKRATRIHTIPPQANVEEGDEAALKEEIENH